MRRKLLLLEGAEDHDWLREHLHSRIRFMTVASVKTLDHAQSAIANDGGDIILTDSHIDDGASTANLVHVLSAYAPGVPILVMTNLAQDDDNLVDVIALGVRHVLYKEELKDNPAKLIGALVDTLRDVTARESAVNTQQRQLQAIREKVWEVSHRVGSMEDSVAAVTSSMDTLTDSLTQRGGLEDRMKQMEERWVLCTRIAIGIGGALGPILAAVFAWLSKR